jgi:muconate cycloisomerase
MSIHPRIDSVETILVDLPTIRPHKLSMTVMSGQTLMIVRIRSSDGIIGVGEGTTIGGLAYGPESPEGMKLAIDRYFAPHLLGSDPTRVGALRATIGGAARDNHFAKCAVETALLDAMGKRTGLSVADLLGGRVRDALPVAWPGPSPAATRRWTSPKPRRCCHADGTTSSSSRSDAERCAPTSRMSRR